MSTNNTIAIRLFIQPRAEAQHIAQLNNVPLNHVNAIEHAYTSAALQRDFGGVDSGFAARLGNFLEYDAYVRYQYFNGADLRADTFKDLWNNEIGRQIGDYVRQNGLSQGDLEELIIDAYNRGILIPDVTDPRVPSDFPGSPSDFPSPPPWPGPQGGWTPGGGAGAAGGAPIPPIGNPSSPVAGMHPNPLLMRDPLIFDLNGDGIELVGVDESLAYFDYGGSGFAIHTGWVGPNDGILIRDLDQNSSISAAEIFGAVSGNALADLATHDGNSDGKIDANDAIFSDLKIWIDSDGNGAGDAGELISLSQAGIAAVNLDGQSSGASIEGNIITQTTTFIRSNGTTGAVAEVNFATDTLNSQYSPPPGFEFSQSAFLLPDLIGYGIVPDLIYSMSLRSDLEDAVLELVLECSSMSGTEFDAAFENLIQLWVEVDDLDPTSQGTLIDARHMAVVESFYGISYAEVNGAQTPVTPFNAKSIEATYQSILDTLKIRFVSQVWQAQLLNDVDPNDVESGVLFPFAGVEFNAGTDQIQVDFSSLVAMLVNRAPTGAQEQFSYYDLQARLIKSLRVDLFSENTAELISEFKTAATSADLSVGFQEFIAAEIVTSKIIAASEAGATVNGTSAGDVLLIDESGHTIVGGSGADTYVYAFAGITAEIVEGGIASPGDQLILLGINPEDVSISRSATNTNDLILAFAGGGTLTVKGQFGQHSWDTIEKIVFDNGVEWTSNEIQLLVLAQAATNGNDNILGFAGDDVIAGGLGNDFLQGGYGNDTYVYTLGDGNDVILDYGIGLSPLDKLALHGIDPNDVVVTQSSSDLDDIILTFTDGGTVTLDEQLHNLGWHKVEQIVFDDQTIWDFLDLLSFLGAGPNPEITHLGTSSAETITGTSGSDVIRGLGGDDTLIGGASSDAYIYEAGDGDDLIDEGDNQAFDELQLVGLTPQDVTISRGGNHLYIDVNSTGERITVQNQFAGGLRGIESIVFADGTIWDRAAIYSAAWFRGTSGNDTITGTSGVDTLDGAAGDDILNGADGSDTYVYGIGYGNDLIDESADGTSVDKIVLVDLNASDVTLSRYGNDLFVTIDATGETLTVDDHFHSNSRGMEQIVFADGTIWDRPAIQDAAWFRGTSGDDSMTGSSWSETFDGGAGNDTLTGAGGSDTYLYGAGYGNDLVVDWGSSSDVDKIKLIDLNPSDVTLSRIGISLSIKINATGEYLTDQQQFSTNSTSPGVEQLIFANGTIWDSTTIQNEAWYRGGSGNDTLTGTNWSETFDGGSGNDTLTGAGGSDTYLYGTGYGNDLIVDWGSSSDVDKIKLIDLNPTDVTLSRSGNALSIKINATGETLTDQEQFSTNSSSPGVEQIIFADETVWDATTILNEAWIFGTSSNNTLNGTSGPNKINGLEGNDTINGLDGNDLLIGDGGNDSLNGGAGDDVLDGGDGNDNLTGGANDDTFVFRTGFGQDVVTDFSAGAATDDVLEFRDGLFADVAAILAAASQVGSHTVISLDASNSITLQNVALANLHADDFRIV